MQDICRQAGVSAGALYLYFASKEALIEGIAHRDRAEILSEFAQAAEGRDIVEGLVGILRSCVVEAPAHKPALLMEMGAEATRNPAIARAVNACDGAIREQLEQILTRATAEGAIAPTAPIPTVAALMAIIADGLFWRRAVDPAFDCAAITPHVIALIGALMNVRARTPEPA